MMAEEFIDIEVEPFRKNNRVDFKRLQIFAKIAEPTSDRLGFEESVYIGGRGRAGVPDFAFAGKALMRVDFADSIFFDKRLGAGVGEPLEHLVADIIFRDGTVEIYKYAVGIRHNPEINAPIVDFGLIKTQESK